MNYLSIAIAIILTTLLLAPVLVAAFVQPNENNEPPDDPDNIHDLLN